MDKKVEVVVNSLSKHRKNIDEDTIELIKEVVNKEDLYDELLVYSKVLEQGKWSIPQYLNAVRYITYQAMGYSNIDSFLKVFPDKLGTKDLDKYVNKFNKSVLVNELRKIVVIAPYLLHQELNQKALYVNADLMMNAKSEMVRHLAAKSILEYTKPPEDNHLSIDVNIKKDDSIEQLEKTLMQVASKQVEAIESGSMSNKEVAEMNIINVEVEDD